MNVEHAVKLERTELSRPAYDQMDMRVYLKERKKNAGLRESGTKRVD